MVSTRLKSLVVFCVCLTGCATQVERDALFDNRLRMMTGVLEAGLLSGMGRIPDNSYQLEDGSKILQWRWETSYIDPGVPPMYWGGRGRGWGGAWWMPMGGFPPTLVREGCIVEWTLVSGLAQAYRWQGSGCRKIAT